MIPGSFLSAYISVHLRLLFFLCLLRLFAAILIVCLPFASLHEFFLILLVAARTNHLSLFTSHPIPPAAGRQGLAGAAMGAASGVPGSVLTDN